MFPTSPKLNYMVFVSSAAPALSKMQKEGILESFQKIAVAAVGVFGIGSQGKPFFQFIHPFVLQPCSAQNSAKIDECHFVNSRGLYVTPWNSSDTSLDWQTANKSEGGEGDMVQEPNLGREGRGAGHHPGTFIGSPRLGTDTLPPLHVLYSHPSTPAPAQTLKARICPPRATSSLYSRNSALDLSLVSYG